MKVIGDVLFAFHGNMAHTSQSISRVISQIQRHIGLNYNYLSYPATAVYIIQRFTRAP